MTIDLPYVASGLGVGLLVGMTGVGGGSLMTPLLILVFGIHPASAVGTDLWFAASTKTLGTVVHGFGRNITWRVVARLATGSVPATGLTLLLLSRVPLHGEMARAMINTVLGVALLITAVALLFRHLIIEHYGARLRNLPAARRNALTVLTGALLGVLVSISSVGAGALGVTALVLLYPEQPTARIVGSDIAHAVPLTFLAGFGHFLIGSVEFGLLGSLLLGSLPGVLLGSLAASRVPEPILRPIFAATLIAVGSRMLL
jgi:hypothetical protein